MTSLEGSSKNVEKFFSFAINSFHLYQKKKRKEKKQTKQTNGVKKKRFMGFSHIPIANNLLLVVNFLLLGLINCKPPAFQIGI
jgi:hypothetical protein